MTAGSAGAPGGVERGEAGTTVVVLRAGGGSWRTVPRSLGSAALTALGTGLLGLALVLPVAVIVLFSGSGWATVGVVALWMVSVAVAAGFAGALAAACFRVYRIMFSAAGDPPAVGLVRGLRRWRGRLSGPLRGKGLCSPSVGFLGGSGTEGEQGCPRGRTNVRCSRRGSCAGAVGR
ncbi:hypothetical protein ACFYRL_36300 [Streptomyces goshikiensis]|uniref:hypothetical protein n=1 Tax=Streptomyces goshikiensis TaxID=1942 RepID=UPI003675CCA7